MTVYNYNSQEDFDKALAAAIEFKEFDILLKFNKKFFTDEIMRKYQKEIEDSILRYIKYTDNGGKTKFSQKSFIGDFALREKKVSLMPCIVNLSNDFILENSKALLDYLTPENLSSTPLSNNPNILKVIYDNKRIDLYPVMHVLTEEMADVIADSDDLFNFFVNETLWYGNSTGSEKLLRRMLDTRDVRLLNLSYSDEVIDKYYNELFDILIIFTSNSLGVSYDRSDSVLGNLHFIDKLADNKEYFLMLYCGLTEEIIDKYFDELCKALKKEKLYLPLQTRDIFVKKTLERGEFDVAFNHIFNWKCSNEIIDKYYDQMVEVLEKKDSDHFLGFRLNDEEYLINKLMNDGKYEIIMSFFPKFINDKIIDKYYDRFVEEIMNPRYFRRLVDNLNDDAKGYLINKLMNEKKFELVISGFPEFINDKFIEEHLDAISPSSFKLIDKKYYSNLLDKLLLHKRYEDALSLEYFDKDIFDKYMSQELIDAICSYPWSYNVDNPKYFFDILRNNRKVDLIIEGFEFNYPDFIDEFYPEIVNYLNNYEVNYQHLRILSISSYDYLYEKLMKNNEVKILLENFGEKLDSSYIDKNFDKICELLDYISTKNDYLTIKLLKNKKYYMINPNNITLDVFNACRLEYIEYLESRPFNISISEELIDSVINFLLENKRSDLLNKFSFGNYIKKYYSVFIKASIDNNTVFNVLKFNVTALMDFIKLGRFDLIYLFSESVFDTLIKTDSKMKEFISYIKNELNGFIPRELSHNMKLKAWCLDNNEFSLFSQFCFSDSDDFKLDDETYQLYGKILNIDPAILKKKIEFLLSKNDEIFKTLVPAFLAERYSTLSNKNFMEISLYPELQFSIIKLSDKEYKLFLSVISVLNNMNIDIKNYIHDFLENISLYSDLINTINFDNLTEEQIKNLMVVIKDKNNTFQIDSVDKLTNDNFLKQKELIFAKYKQKILNGTIEIEELRNVVLLKIFGLTLEETKFICVRYVDGLDGNTEINHRLKEILLMINNIYTTNNIDELKVLFNGKRINSCLDFEAVIRREYARVYNKTLYQLKDSDLIKEKVTDPKILERINKMEYSGYRPRVYLPTGDFRMQISALGAYSQYTRPDNFMDEWLCPKIASHGICTSYIANNQIANARAYHPILGFASFEDSSLLLCANYDIGSSSANITYDVSQQRVASFKTPNRMIDNTRHTHNEMVIDRLIQDGESLVKRTPDYIVYPIDDINDPYCFMTKSELIEEFRNNEFSDEVIEKISNASNLEFLTKLENDGTISPLDAHKVRCAFIYEETLQASHDMNVPIVILDRLYHAKREKQECLAMVNDFKNKLDVSLLPKILCEYINNLIGCTQYFSIELEYNKVFNLDDLKNIFDDIRETILKIDSISVRRTYIEYYINSFKREISKFKVQNFVDDKFMEIVCMLNDIKNSAVTEYNQDYIDDYCAIHGEEVRARINDDIANNVDILIIKEKLESGAYLENDNNYGGK